MIKMEKEVEEKQVTIFNAESRRMQYYFKLKYNRNVKMEVIGQN